MTDIGVGFRDADGAMLGELARCLDFLNDLPFFRAYKAATWAALDIRASDRILDVACGTGFDLIEMARRHPSAEFCGVDRSQGLLAIAKSRARGLPNVRFVRGEAARLTFEAGAFDGVRIDRALQHFEDPPGAVAEMVRVARPGGRIVAAEPDWGAYILYNGDQETSEKVAARWRQSIRNPFVARELGALLSGCGIESLRGETHAFSTTDYDRAAAVFDLERTLDRCVEAGALSTEKARRWRADAQSASAKGAFLAALTVVVFSGMAK
jgi:SAM-dependent methyltransferase